MHKKGNFEIVCKSNRPTFGENYREFKILQQCKDILFLHLPPLNMAKSRNHPAATDTYTPAQQHAANTHFIASVLSATHSLIDIIIVQ